MDWFTIVADKMDSEKSNLNPLSSVQPNPWSNFQFQRNSVTNFSRPDHYAPDRSRFFSQDRSDVEEMDPKQIIHQLYSKNSFLTKKKREQLEEMLETAKRLGKISEIDAMFTTIGVMSDTQNLKEEKEEQQPLPTCVVPATETIFNHGKLIGLSSNIDDQIKFLVPDADDNNTISVSYKDIEDVIENSAIFRVKMLYLKLRQQLHFLDSLSLIHKTKGDYAKKKCSYQKLRIKETECMQCVSVYILFDGILKCYQNLMDIIQQIGNDRSTESVDVIKITLRRISKFIDTIDTVSVFDGNYASYADSYREHLGKLKKLVSDFNEIDDCHRYYHPIRGAIDGILSDMKSISKKQDHVNRYTHHIYFDSDTQTFELRGLASIIYSPCDQLDDFSIPPREYDDVALSNMTLREIDCHLSYLKSDKPNRELLLSNAITIRDLNFRQSLITLNFETEDLLGPKKREFVEEQPIEYVEKKVRNFVTSVLDANKLVSVAPSKKIIVKITDVPEGICCLSAMMNLRNDSEKNGEESNDSDDSDVYFSQ